MKFPMPNQVGEVKGDQQEVRQCNHQVVKVAYKLWQFHVVDERPSSEGPLDDTIDPRSQDEEGTTGTIEGLVDLPVDDKEPSKVLKIGKNSFKETQKAISKFLKQNLDVFAWTHSGMEGIDSNVMSHRLNIDLSRRPVRHKIQAMDAECYQALKEEVDKLLSCDFIKDSFYPS